jgi:hypothetical protein
MGHRLINQEDNMGISRVWVLDPWDEDIPKEVRDDVMQIQQDFELNQRSYWPIETETFWEYDDDGKPILSYLHLYAYLSERNIESCIVLIDW